jgi:hypothetical protein
MWLCKRDTDEESALLCKTIFQHHNPTHCFNCASIAKLEMNLNAQLGEIATSNWLIDRDGVELDITGK